MDRKQFVKPDCEACSNLDLEIVTEMSTVNNEYHRGSHVPRSISKVDKDQEVSIKSSAVMDTESES